MSPIDGYTTLARKAISHWFKTGKILETPADSLPAEFSKRKAGVFVSLHSPDKELRGCIGTFKPTKENIAQEIISNSLSAALCDNRFQPIDKKEFENIKIEVSILNPPEKISSPKQLNPDKYGVIVQTEQGRCGLLLPSIDGIETVDQQLTIAGQKCGIDIKTQKHQLLRFTVEKHGE